MIKLKISKKQRWLCTDQDGKHEIPEWAFKFVDLLIGSRGTVLSLCDLTGNMARPWAEAEFECICVDFQHRIFGE